jgi:transketolase
MRNTFINTLVEIAKEDPRVFLLTGDLGYTALEPFADTFPDRFLNAGAAEQNMVGVATGLAEAGYIPFVYSIATFATLRPYEFIRNGPIVHRLPVRIVGVGGGTEYGHNGLSHYAVEDVAVMRAQPGISVFAPADSQQTKTVLRDTWNLAGPIYYRLGKDDRKIVPNLNGRFTLGKAELIRDGQNILIASMGAAAFEAEQAVEELNKRGVKCAHMVVASINPAPFSDFAEVFKRFDTILTVECHYRSGGLNSLVSEFVAEHGLKCRVARCAIEAQVQAITGSQQYLNSLYGLSTEQIIESAMRFLPIASGASQ